jgi:acetyl esterase/lipase
MLRKSLGAIMALAAAAAIAQERIVPARPLPVPTDVSPQIQALASRPIAPNFDVVPQTIEEWVALQEAYGDMHGFPPAILTTGTRDLLLSNTVRTHRKLKDAGVEAELNVFEAMSHANYAADDTAPETHQAFGDIAKFFERHLAK